MKRGVALPVCVQVVCGRDEEVSKSVLRHGWGSADALEDARRAYVAHGEEQERIRNGWENSYDKF